MGRGTYSIDVVSEFRSLIIVDCVRDIGIGTLNGDLSCLGGQSGRWSLLLPEFDVQLDLR